MMWKEKYRIGVELIDTQHQELFRRLSDFIQIVQNNIPWNDKLEEVKETLNFLQEYVVFHFNDEEAYMKEINYPDLELHKKIHKDFRDEINEYGKLFAKEGFTEEKIQELNARLMTWLIMHVGKMDQQIGIYTREKGGQ